MVILVPNKYLQVTIIMNIKHMISIQTLDFVELALIYNLVEI